MVLDLQEKGLILSSQKGLKRCYFQFSKKRGHPVIIFVVAKMRTCSMHIDIN